MQLRGQQSEDPIDKAIKMSTRSFHCLAAVIAASLLISCAAKARPRSTVRQEPIFECTNVIGAERFDDLVKRVVSVAENQAFLTTQSVDPNVYPVSVLPNGNWETKQPGGWVFYSWSMSCSASSSTSNVQLAELQLHCCCCCSQGTGCLAFGLVCCGSCMP